MWWACRCGGSVGVVCRCGGPVGVLTKLALEFPSFIAKQVGGMAAQEEVTKTHHKDRPTLYELISKLHKLSLEE